MLLIGKNSQS